MSFDYKDGVLHAEDVPLTSIADEMGTPTYVYSYRQIHSNYLRLQSTFASILPADKQPLIAYACKANGSMAIMKAFVDMGAGIDVVSGGELDRALMVKTDPDKIVFSGVGKTDSEILAAIRAQIRQINVESPSEMRRISMLAKSINTICPVAFRFNPHIEVDTHAKIATGNEGSKFGMPLEEVLELYQEATEDPGLHPVGLSMHIGSKVKTVKTFEKAFKRMAVLTDMLRKSGLQVNSIDLGGGFGAIPAEDAISLEGFAKAINDVIVPLDTDIILEPGQILVGNAGVLLTRVTYIKETPAKNFLLIDAGMTDFIRPSMYGAEHPILPVVERDGKAFKCDIAGPICESSDIVATKRSFKGIEEGDLLAIMETGAYGIVHASPLYNGRFIPQEAMVDGKEVALIREFMDVSDITKYERYPHWMKV